MKTKLIVILTWVVLIGVACDGSKNSHIPDIPDLEQPEELQEIEFPTFVKGIDLSYVNQIEDYNGKYTANGDKVDPFNYFSEKGANLVRLRLWHNPMWIEQVYGKGSKLYSGFDDVKNSIQRSKNAGMAVCLDLHYSDTWADPGTQDVPEAWKAITSIDVLEDSVYNYTYTVLNRLFQEGLLPEMVQLGNENNQGVMTTGKGASFPNLNIYNGNWINFGKIINAGIKAVRDIDAKAGRKTQIALHVADPKNLEWWTSDAINKGKIHDFDIMGFSYYHIWHTTISFDDLPKLINQLTKSFNKKFLVLETAYPFTDKGNDTYNNIYYDQPIVSGFPYTVQGQHDFMTQLNRNMAKAGALGVIYWEPAWITSDMRDLWGKGSSWENCALFDFTGNSTDAIDYLSEDYL